MEGLLGRVMINYVVVIGKLLDVRLMSEESGGMSDHHEIEEKK